MISMEQISGEIAALEEERPTHVTMQKLASLYIVRDHMAISNQKLTPTVAVENVVTLDSDTDFAKTINGKKSEWVWNVMDDLMSALAVIQPKLYESAMSKLDGLY